VSAFDFPPAARHLPGIEAARALVHGEPGAGWAVTIHAAQQLLVVVPSFVGVAWLLGLSKRGAAVAGVAVVGVIQGLSLWHASNERDQHSGAPVVGGAPKLTLIDGGL
jgi:hypothetical protein